MQSAHHVRELARGELASSTRAVTELGESVCDVVRHEQSCRRWLMAGYLDWVRP